MVPEAYGFDAVSALGFLAALTERVELMSGILPVYSRTPALLAMTAAGLDAVSHGRFSLGLGVSGPQVVEGWHGVAYDAPLGRSREVMEICRSVWRREPLAHAGTSYAVPLPPDRGSGLGKPLRLMHRPLRSRIPIYLAALGPRNVELAARSAEGWIPHLYVPERADLVWGEPLRRGASVRDPDLAPLEIVAGGSMAIGGDVGSLRDLERPHLALYVGGMGAKGANFYHQVVSAYGWGREADAVQDLYLAGRRDDAAAALPADLLEATTLIGDEAYLRDRLAAFVDQGVTVLHVTPIGPDPVGDLARLAALCADA
jgi:F420-dependent oxidoreductase-like protein